ncbi:MAG: ABC transporter permease [Chloroflexi bacterium]|nr:ABC transporter permease [Chloroflexota bacterium]
MGMLILMFFVAVAIFAPIISPYDPNTITSPYLKPSREHFLGTNDIGQDIFSELIYGARLSLFIGFFSAFIVTLVGSVLGIVSGYYKGIVGRIIMGVTNIALVIPSLPLTIVLAAYMQASIWNIIIAICATSWAGTARIIRSRTLQIRELPFIKIEHALGVGNLQIMFAHILPNVLEVILIKGTLAVSSAMLTEAGLSFLGLSSSTAKSWGSILHYAFFRNGVLNNYWWWYMPPIICISLCVLGFMLLGYHGKGKNKTTNKMELT